MICDITPSFRSGERCPSPSLLRAPYKQTGTARRPDPTRGARSFRLTHLRFRSLEAAALNPLGPWHWVARGRSPGRERASWTGLSPHRQTRTPPANQRQDPQPRRPDHRPARPTRLLTSATPSRPPHRHRLLGGNRRLSYQFAETRVELAA